MILTVVVGNPKVDSRTLKVALSVAGVIERDVADFNERVVIDLAVLASELFEFESIKVNEFRETVASSDLLVVASPTFKASYTGMLKAFFDPFATNALAGTVAVAVMTGAAPDHAIAVDVHLRPLLVELGASVPTRGLYVVEKQFEDLDNVTDSWAAQASPLISRALA